jgi:hypothetical protein
MGKMKNLLPPSRHPSSAIELSLPVHSCPKKYIESQGSDSGLVVTGVYCHPGANLGGGRTKFALPSKCSWPCLSQFTLDFLMNIRD